MKYRKRLIALVAALALGAAAPVAGQASSNGPSAVTSKTCSTGYKHGIINGAHKCLRAGQFCSTGADSQYHKYGFHCHSSGHLIRK